MDLDNKQREAISACCDVNRRVVAITGVAGTGKTTIMKIVYEKLTEAGYAVALCAPTGKAAKRIKEATGIRAQTIHALLEYTHPGERDEKTGELIGISYPKRDKKNPLPYNIVLADEYAMVNEEVHRNLFDAIQPGGRVCLFGDVNQLQPIEKERRSNRPSPFQSIIKRFEGIYLDTIHRQDEGSGIVSNGARILRGNSPRRLEDFEMNITDAPVRALCDYVREHTEDFITTRNQIITPSNRTWVGTHKLNAALQSVFMKGRTDFTELPRHKWVKTGMLRVCPGDKVVITTNNYDIRPEDDRFMETSDGKTHFLQPEDKDQVFNGETGIIKEISIYGEVVIDLGDRVVTIPPELSYKRANGATIFFDPRRDIELAYAVTTHKAQGSEYDRVIYVLNKSMSFVMNRRNFYTAITRARNHVLLISDQKSLSHSLWKKEG